MPRHRRRPVDALIVDPPEKRRELQFSKSVSEGDREKIRRNMLAKGQLWAERHPTIRFDAGRCERIREGDILVRGNLSVRGVASQVDLPMSVAFDEGTLRARVGFDKTHADFGFKPYSAALGALKNADVLSFYVDLRATRTGTVTRATGPSSAGR
ncbi:MAG: YceI family protein [Myxococcales bacterium]|nr:YceI family protein [Myxococcales bacterium]